MDSFEDGCIVSLRFSASVTSRHPFRYASMTGDRRDTGNHAADIFLNTSDHCKDTFKLTKHSGIGASVLHFAWL